MKSGIAQNPINELVVQFDADGAQGRVDLAPSVTLPQRPQDEPDDTDFVSMYGVYYNDDGNLIPEYKDEMPNLEPVPKCEAMPQSKISMDTEQSGHMGTLSLASPPVCRTPEPSDLKVQVSTLPSGEIWTVQKVIPPPPKFELASSGQINIKELFSQVSRRVTQSVIGQLTGVDPSDDEDNINVRRALEATRKTRPVLEDKGDNIQAILCAAKTGNKKVIPSERVMDQPPYGQMVTPVQLQQELEMIQRGVQVT